MEKFAVNSQARAQGILSSKKVVFTEGTYECTHRVSERIFEWEDGSKYRIVNTNLMNDYQKKEVIALLQDQKFQEATNKGLTFRASLELAEQLESVIESVAKIELVEVAGGEQALLIRKMRPVAAKKAQGFGFSDIFMTTAPEITDKIEEQVQA